jgi:protein-disulfide isomerase
MRLLSVALILTILPALAPAQDAPKSKAELEQVIHDYLLKHPEVVIEAVAKYQENQRLDEKKKAEQSISTNQQQLINDPNSPAAGADASKALTVVEFFDYRCGYCKRMAPTVAKFVNAAKIRLVYKELPILGPDSIIAAKAALAARKQGDYVKFHMDLMSLQGTITMAAIEAVAAKNGMNVAQLKTDMEAPDIQAQIAVTQKLAQTIGVDATPSFVIGNQLITGAMDETEFQAAINKAPKP